MAMENNQITVHVQGTSVTVDKSTTGAMLKYYLCEAGLNGAPVSIRLSYKGRQLDDERTMESYGIPDGASLLRCNRIATPQYQETYRKYDADFALLKQQQTPVAANNPTPQN
eukprot:CAMPEP_0174250220 /NCGR_PEP_ID=MMETSP0439-20130205/463_1 /TAXON_ID=0 /ORGANISM="Stereomyxa ramosa, Strain Chinc5" /LENGTH=111 /DNA_ID=CAMNT_0015330231 /DNA_START=37 /DNA_END=372 /DNA_ORIENTATION=+